MSTYKVYSETVITDYENKLNRDKTNYFLYEILILHLTYIL